MVFGTNSAATANMMKARANRGATGENAIRVSIDQADIILAPVASVIPNSYMGELTSGMAEAIASSPGRKYFYRWASFTSVSSGVDRQPLPHLMEEALARVRQLLGIEGGGEDGCVNLRYICSRTERKDSHGRCGQHKTRG